MSAIRTAVGAFAVAAMLALVVSASAGAAVRYAAPLAGTAEPCNPTPCTLAKAISGAKPGDQVILTPGSYTSGSDLLLNQAIDVGGTPGAATSIAFTGGKAAIVEDAAASLHDVQIALAEPAMAYALSLEAGTVERVYVDGRNGIGCQMAQGLLRDSVCVGGLDAHPVGAGSYSGTIVNVTATRLSVGAHDKAKFTATIINSIALTEDGGAGDLDINVGPESSVAVSATNSSFAAVDTSLSSGTGFTYTPAGTNGNQTVPPQLVDPANGDFRPLASSPTVDAGTVAALLGPLDLAGGLRSQPACIGGTPVPDIGAYEFVPTVDCPSSPPPAKVAQVSPQSGPPAAKVSFGKLSRNSESGTARLPVALSSVGMVVLKGKGVRGREVGGARVLTLVIKAKGAKMSKLKRTGKVKLRPMIVFTPLGGTPVTAVRPVTLKLALD